MSPSSTNKHGARELAVEALRALDDAAAVAPLVAAATDEPEPDIAVEMCEAAFELAGPDRADELRGAVDILLRIIEDDDSPRAARRDALEHLLRHVDHAATGSDREVATALAEWWKRGRDRAVWDPTSRRFAVSPPPDESIAP